MRSLSDAIRAKRYKLKNETPIVVKTLAPSNELISIKLSDCSLTGFSGQITENSQEVDILSSGTIFSSAKLVTPEGLP